MSTLAEEDKLIHTPSWCAELQNQIEFEVLLEEEGFTRSEGLRNALDEYFQIPHITEILSKMVM